VIAMPDRTQAPQPGLSIKYQLPGIEKFILSSGIEIYSVKKDKLPVVFAELIVFSGSRYDGENKKGLSYLTSCLIDEGAGEYDSLQLSGEFEKLGSVFSISSDHDKTIFSIMSLKENFSRTLELLSKIIYKPRFEEKDFQREKKKVIDHILQLKDEPSFIASAAFEHLIFESTCYGYPEIGFSGDLENISNIDVRNFYGTNFLQSPASVVIVGNFNSSEIIERFENEFGNWNLSPERTIRFIQPGIREASYFMVHKENSPQSELRIGHLSKLRSAPDYIPARLMNAILGGQFSSRINLNLRENKGFTYGATSAFLYYRESAFFEISTAVNIENSGQAVKEILKEIDGIRYSISENEIYFAKSYLIKQFPSQFETYPQIAKNIESLLIHSLDLNQLSLYTGRIEAASADEIRRAALENIFPDKMTVLIAGDRIKIREQLKSALNAEPTEVDLYGNPV